MQIRRLWLGPLLAAVSVLQAGTPELYPAPRQIEPGAGRIVFGRNVRIESVGPAVDAPTVGVLQAAAARTSVDAKGLTVRYGWRGQPGIDTALQGVPEVSGAYRIRIARDGILIAGHDARGAYYGSRTIAALAAAGPTLSESILTDWPEVPMRGVVEGFYGTPWSHARRLSLIRFMGEVGLDTYIYGPKDDPYHSSPHWRKPYPAEEAARIQELVEACRAHHVDFYWAVHPGKDIRWDDADFAAVLAKFEAMHALGVRAFSVFFDDISGEGTKADQQARLLNFLNERFVKAKGDVQPLVMCPTQYNRAWSGGDYLEVLGRTLDPSIHVMWTGDRVVADLDRRGMEWINGRLRRKATIWWNFPVSDYVRNHLLLGPVYGNANDIGPLYGGFVSNPMERSEASKVALFGVAAYTWNPSTYQPSTAWRAGIRRVVPQAADAYETFSAHNSDLGPNGHGYRREESVDFAPAAEAFLAELRAGATPDAAAVRPEFWRIAAAPEAIRLRADNPLLIEEIAPWLDAFEQLGRAGLSGVDALSDVAKRDVAAAWRDLSAAIEALRRIEEIDRVSNRNPYQPGIRTGSKVVMPLVREVVETAGSRLLVALGARPSPRGKPVVSSSEVEGLERMSDGREETFAYIKKVQAAGDWIGLDLGGTLPIRRIRLLQGRDDRDHDRIHQGVLEGLTNAGQWREICRVKDARTDFTLDTPLTCSRLRLRVLKPGVPGGKPDLWTAIREFEINPVDAAEVRSTLPALRRLPVRLVDGVFSISPAFEVHALSSGGQFGLQLPEATEVRAVEVDLGRAEPLKSFVVEGSVDGNGWEVLKATADGTRLKASPARALRSVRVRNQSSTSVEITVKAFTITTPIKPVDPALAASDGMPRTFVAVKDQVLELPMRGTSKRVTLLLTGDISALRVAARTAAGEHPLSSPKADSLITFILPPGTRSLCLRAEVTKTVRVHEVIQGE